MIRPNELYDKTKLPIDEKLLDKLIQKYFSISFTDMSRMTSDLGTLLYKKINIVDDKTKKRFNQLDLNSLIAEISKDYDNAGRPFDPKLYNGTTSPLGIMAGWYTFQSWNLLGTEKIHSNQISHRFYFGISNDKLYEFSKYLYEKLKKAKIPFYFKTETNQYVERTDNLVLYTSTPLLGQTLKLLDDMQKERLDLFASCSEPSILAGRLTNSIGYATEDHNAKTSYTDFICKTFIDTLDSELRKIIHDRTLTQIISIYNQKKQEYINAGRDISSDRVRQRILLDILIKYEPNFKKKLLQSFRQKLIANGIDIENICFNKTVKREIEQYYGFADFFSPDVQNKVITLPNGKTMTISEYYRLNNLEYWVPQEAKIIFKSGRTITGREFLNESVSRLEQFNTWEELVLHYGIMIVRHLSVQKEKKKAESQSEVLIDDKRKDQEQEYQQRVSQIHQQLFLENMARQQFSLEEQRKQIEEQMNSQSFGISENNDCDMNYGSSGIER